MPYKYAKENKDYSDYASGRVFYSAPGHPAFPVRLVSEVFQRCWAQRQANGFTTPASIYDPCCGSAYHLSTLAHLHWSMIDRIIVSDNDAKILEVAKRNLSLLTQSGLEKRVQEIAVMYDTFGKSSHIEAAKSAQQLTKQKKKNLAKHQIGTRYFTADATNRQEIIENISSDQIDIIICDVPYGNQSEWQFVRETKVTQPGMLWQMLDALLTIIHKNTIVAISANKAQKCAHTSFKRVDRLQMGKRRITFLQLNS